MESQRCADLNEKKESETLTCSGLCLDENFHVYRDDVVKLNEKEHMLGIVQRVPGEPDSDRSFSEDSDGYGDESDSDTVSEKYDELNAGQVEILWHDGSETTNSVYELRVVDRGFVPGDAVSLVSSDPANKIGVVTGADITADLLTPTGELITGVSCRDLKRFQKFVVDDYVVCGSWIGRVDDIVEDITIQFDDGSSCQILEADPSSLTPLSRGIVDDSDFPYYPGQRVSTVSSSSPNHCEATITKVEVQSLIIEWITSAGPSEAENGDNIPSGKQPPEKVTLLPFLLHAAWKLGDWCLTTKYTEGEAEHEKASVITSITTKVDVAWQDGTRKFQLDSRLLVPTDNLGEEDFFPEECVVYREDVNRVGVVKCVYGDKRLAHVRWMRPADSAPEDLKEFEEEDEVVGVDEIDSHPVYNFCYGDLVVRLTPVAVPFVDDASNLSWFGQVIDLNDGHIEVRWGDGHVSKVGRQDISVVDDEDDDYEDSESG